MLGQIDLAHAPLSKLLSELILTQLPRMVQIVAKAVQDEGGEDRQRRADQDNEHVSQG